MGMIVLVLGHSGTGKSTSLRNFEPGEVAVFEPMGKPLPFRNDLDVARTRDYATIKAAIKANKYKCYVVDDANYLMQLENFNLLGERGYDKFTRMASNFEQLLECAAFDTSDDTTVYIMMHVDFYDDGRMKPKTIGKMLDNQLCVEGVFPTCLLAVHDDDGYGFMVHDPGATPVKTPFEMFEGVERIDNDLKAFDTDVRKHLGMKPLVKAAKDNDKKGN